MKKTKIILCAAVSALAISAPSSLRATETVLAKVNGKDITTKDLAQLKKSIPVNMLKQAEASGNMQMKLIEQLVDVKVLSDAALKSNVAKKKEVQQAIEYAKEQTIVQAFIFEQLSAKINDAALEAEYKTLKDKFIKEVKNKKEMKIRHILLKDEAAAKTALKRLKSGEDFQKLARELSEDKRSGQDGGDLGYLLEGTAPEFDAALAKIKTGKTSTEATKTKFGYHIFKIDDRRNAKPPKFADVKPQLSKKVQQDAFLNLVKRLRNKASVEIIAKDEPKK